MLKPFKIRKPDFSIKRPSLHIKLHRPNLELNNLAAELHIPANKSFRRELARKSIHLSSLWIPALIYFAHPGVSIMLFAILFLGDALLEYGNFKKWRWARRTFGLLFFKTLRNKERIRTKFQVSGSMYVLAAAIICTLLFSKPIAAIALTVMLISDTCAALFGKATVQENYIRANLWKERSPSSSALCSSTCSTNLSFTSLMPASSPALPPPWQKCSKTSSKLTTICLFRFS